METISNHASASMIDGTSGADLITNIGAYSTINAGDGNDTIVNDREQAIAIVDDNGLYRYQTINVEGKYSLIDGGLGADRIIDNVGYSTLHGGAGNDTVTLGAYSVFDYADGDGKDVLYNYAPTNMIRIAANKLSTTTSGKDVVLKVGTGSITLKNAKGSAIATLSADENVKLPVERKVINGTSGDDTLYVEEAGATVNGGEGNDLIRNVSNASARVLMLGGKGNDTLESNSPNVVLIGGEGNDQLILNGSNQIIRYEEGDGKDTVVGYDSSDTLHLIDGSKYTTTTIGANVIVKVEGGTITLKDAKGQALNIDQSTLDSDREVEWEIAVPGSEKLEYNKKKGIVTLKDGFNGLVDAMAFGYVTAINAASVHGEVALRANRNSAVLTASKGGATLEGSAGNDKLYGGKDADVFIYNVGEGQDLIGNTKDLNTLFQAKDSLVIVGDDYYDLSDLSFVDKKESVVVTFNSDKKSKLTITKDSTDTPINIYFGPTSDTALNNIGVTYGELPDGVHYASKGKALDYTKLLVDDTLEDEVIEARMINSQIVQVDASNADGFVEIIGNARNNIIKVGVSGGLLDGDSGSDQLYGSPDPTVEDTFVFRMQPAMKRDVIYNYNDDDVIVIDASLLEKEFPSFDEERQIISYDGAKSNFNGFNDTKNDVVITLNKKNTLTIKDGAGKAINLVDENNHPLGTFGHFLPDGLKYNDKKTGIEVADTLAASVHEQLIINLSNEDEHENEYFATAVNVDLAGVLADVSLTGSRKNNILRAGDLTTEIRPGLGNDQMYGSTAEGSEVNFYYTAGKDIIVDYDRDKDYVYIDGETPIESSVLETVSARNFSEKGNDVILTLNNKHSITFKDGVGKVIEVFDENGELDDGAGYIKYDFSLPDGLQYNTIKRTAIEITDSDVLVESGFLNLDLSNETNEDYAFSTAVKKVDLSSINDEDFSAVLIGNNQANELHAPNGGSNELYGGHKPVDNPKKVKPTADTLIGGSGEDVFIYAPYDGKDQIMSYGAEDVVKLDDIETEIDSIMIADRKNVVSVTLNGDKNSTFTITKQDINSAITFNAFVDNINGITDWSNVFDEGFVYGPDAEHMTLSADGTKLTLGGEEDEYVTAFAHEISSQIKTIDARGALGVFAEIVGNGNANVIYAGAGGAIMNGGYDTVKLKATNDALTGGSGDDEFVYDFSLGLGGKDTIMNYGVGDDVIQLTTAPKSVTTNGRTLMLNFEEKIDGKKYTGSLLINGRTSITPKTAINIDLDGTTGTYYFASNLKNADWTTSPGITLEGSNAGDSLEGNTSDCWTLLTTNSYAYDYGGIAFTVSGSAVRDWSPNNSFWGGLEEDVIVEDGIPDGIRVNVHNHEIILSDQFDRSKATFTFVEGKTEADYNWTIYDTSKDRFKQLPASDYWFESEPTVEQATDDPLEAILPIENISLTVPDNFNAKLIPSTTELTYSFRHQNKK